MAISPRPATASFLTALAQSLGWRRVLFALVMAMAVGFALDHIFVTPVSVLIGRALLAALLALLAFGVLEHWPRHLPSWLARWVLQLLGVTLAVPLGTLLAYLFSTGGSLSSFLQSEARLLIRHSNTFKPRTSR